MSVCYGTQRGANGCVNGIPSRLADARFVICSMPSLPSAAIAGALHDHVNLQVDLEDVCFNFSIERTLFWITGTV